jgi:hypothetical protein
MVASNVEASRKQSVLSWASAHWSDLLFLLLSLAVLVWVTQDAFSTRIVTLSQGADYWEHSATFRALIDHPLHPQNPHLVSPASSPRFIPSFIVIALAARAAGLDALGAMGIASAVNLVLFFAGIFLFFRSYFRDARASLYGLIVMLGSWYDGWHFSNVYQLKILFSVASYPSTAALGLSLLGFTLTLRTLRGGAQPGWLAGTAACWALVMITHPLTAVLGFGGALLLAVMEPGFPLAVRARVTAAILVGLALSFTWPYFSVWRVLVGGGQEQVAAIADELTGAIVPEPPSGLHEFYRKRELMRALGLSLVGIPVCLYLLVRRRRWFVTLGAAGMLLPFIVNAYRPLPLGHRFILLAIFFLQVAVVWLLLKLTPNAPEAWSRLSSKPWRWLGAAVVAAVLVGASVWNVDAAAERLESSERKIHGESTNLRYARRVGELVGSNGVVLADRRSSWPIPTFGPKVVTLLHENPLVRDERRRAQHVARFFRASTDDKTRAAIIRRYQVTHVLAKRGEARSLDDFLSTRAERQSLPGGYSLYTLRE